MSLSGNIIVHNIFRWCINREKVFESFLIFMEVTLQCKNGANGIIKNKKTALLC